MTLHRDHKHLQSLIDLAVREGWTVSRTPGGHLKFTKQGLPPIYIGVMPDNRYASHGAFIQPCHADQIAGHAHTAREVGVDG